MPGHLVPRLAHLGAPSVYLGVQFVQFASGAPFDRARPLVLVVDDDPAVRRLVARYLYRQGLSAVQAANGAEGIEQLGSGAYAAIVTDVQMPALDGVTMWERATQDRPELRGRFVFCSSVHRDVVDRVGATGERFLRKPFDLSEVWGAVQAVLAGA